MPRVISGRQLPAAGKLVCYKPDGSISRTIEMPVAIPTSVMFGGADLDVLYVTTIGMKVLGMEPGPEGGARMPSKDWE